MRDCALLARCFNCRTGRRRTRCQRKVCACHRHCCFLVLAEDSSVQIPARDEAKRTAGHRCWRLPKPARWPRSKSFLRATARSSCAVMCRYCTSARRSSTRSAVSFCCFGRRIKPARRSYRCSASAATASPCCWAKQSTPRTAMRARRAACECRDCVSGGARAIGRWSSRRSSRSSVRCRCRRRFVCFCATF